ncbi:NUDIX domain-containing protein [Clostridium saccharoperbutylacetonicum]
MKQVLEVGSALKGEEPLEIAVRELKEETGINAENLKKIYKCMG